MNTLQDVIDVGIAFPERYGAGEFFVNGQPHCLVAKEVLSDVTPVREGDLDSMSLVGLAAARLGCSREDVWDVVDWWDAMNGMRKNIERYRQVLLSKGYSVPFLMLGREHEVKET